MIEEELANTKLFIQTTTDKLLGKKYPDGCHVDDYGDKTWYENGVIHRLDGPAFEYHNGNYSVWFYKGERFDNCKSQEEFDMLLKLRAFR